MTYDENRLILLNELFEKIGLKIDADSFEKFEGMVIQRETLLDKKNVKKMIEMIPKLKNIFHSDALSCLHSNSTKKQKTPGVCMLRQILKTTKLNLTPKVKSAGYDKNTGKKLVIRYYVIVKETNLVSELLEK